MANGPITRLSALLRQTRQNQPFGSDNAPNSLFGEILDWMLAPLLILWPVSIAATNHVANNIANQPYDQALAESVGAIAKVVTIDGNRVKVVLPASARKLLHTDEIDTLYHQVTQFDGKVLFGDAEIPPPAPDQAVVVGQVLFRDVVIGGESVRVAYSALSEAQNERYVWVQVAETLHKREQLASRIISGVLLPQFAIIPLAVILVYVGLTRGIRPLSRLQARIRRRRPTDLSPISVERTPEEVQPLVLAFNEMMARLELNLQAQQRFIADAAHQMRTPLTGLKMQTELALSESEPARMREALALIGESTDRAAHLINQLLVLARAEASHEKVHRVEPVDLNALARSAAQEWVERALSKKIDLGFESDHWPLMIEGVPLLLRELLSNLIDNAVKYTPDYGRVTVRTRGSEFVVLEVEDSGIGIAADERERIFERFYRALGTDADGSGLGLPIVAEIAELHRALIEVASTPGGGSLFRVSFARRGGAVSPVDLRPELVAPFSTETEPPIGPATREEHPPGLDGNQALPAAVPPVEAPQERLTKKHRQYWNINLKVSALLLTLWFAATFVTSWYARELNEIEFLGPLGFYMSAQGSLIIFVAIIWFYAHYMNQLDTKYGVSERKPE